MAGSHSSNPNQILSKFDSLRNLDPWLQPAIDWLVCCVCAYRLRSPSGREGLFALSRLLEVVSICSRAKGAPTLDVPAVPEGGNCRHFSHPALPLIRPARWISQSPHPALSRRNRFFSNSSSPQLHGVVPLGQGPGHVRIRHTLGSRDEPGDKLSAVPASATGSVGPAMDSTMENGGDIGGVREGPGCDELWQSRFNVDTAGFGLP